MPKIKLWLHENGCGRSGQDTQMLPTFYMGDWSELALRVSALPPAIELLRREGIDIQVTAAGTLLRPASLNQIPRMIERLNREGLKADLSDRVRRVYQG